MYRAVVQSILNYGSETCEMTSTDKDTIGELEMDFFT